MCVFIIVIQNRDRETDREIEKYNRHIEIFTFFWFGLVPDKETNGENQKIHVLDI